MSKEETQQAILTLRTAGGNNWRWLCSFAVCLAVLSSTASWVMVVDGAPILGPDLNSCRPVITATKNAADAVDCCFIDTGRPIKSFKFDLDLPLRVRRPVHKLDQEFVQKYERGYELMRALPPDDPRSFEAQAKLHCSYCSAAYLQFNTTEVLDVHFSWFNMPFHRWYMYFHERILASLLGDDTFAIPYWAWDVQNETSPPANVIPSIFMNVNSPLFDPRRNSIHLPPHFADLESQDQPHNKDPEVLKRNNYYNMWRVMVGEATTPRTFYGGKIAKGYKVEDRSGRFELGPHAAVHTWTGTDNGEDLGTSYAAGRDPLFYAHHSQVERLWLMWKSFGGEDYDDPDWLDSEFLFYDEHGDIVRVNVRDALNIENFRISYEEVPIDWLDYTPRSIRNTDPKYARTGILRSIWRQVPGEDFLRSIGVMVKSFFHPEERGTSVLLGSGRAVVSSRVPRPKLSLERKTTEKISSGGVSSVTYDEVLVVSGVVVKPFNISVLLKLFMELPEADENTPLDCVEYLGSLNIQAERPQIGEDTTVAKQFTQAIGIGERLQILDISRQNVVTLTFVPRWDTRQDSHVSVTFTDLRIELQVARRRMEGVSSEVLSIVPVG